MNSDCIMFGHDVKRYEDTPRYVMMPHRCIVGIFCKRCRKHKKVEVIEFPHTVKWRQMIFDAKEKSRTRFLLGVVVI